MIHLNNPTVDKYSMIGISLVICCFNSANRLPDTLAHVVTQTVPASIPWEVIVIDNASTDRTAEIARSVWPREAPTSLRVVRENQPGLIHARLRGFRESQYEFVSFIDDDNWISPNWVSNVFTLMMEHPEVGACGGEVEAAYNEDLPSWFSKFAKRFAVGSQYSRRGLIDHSTLWGAGLTIRKQAWDDLISHGFSPLLSGRRGKHQSAGDDSELCFALILAGWKLWYEPRLKLKHFMPLSRVTWRNLCRMSRGFGASGITLELYAWALNGYPSKKKSYHETWIYKIFVVVLLILRSPRTLFASLTFQDEGDEKVLLMQERIGRLTELIRLNYRYSKYKNNFRNASWINKNQNTIRSGIAKCKDDTSN